MERAKRTKRKKAENGSDTTNAFHYDPTTRL